MDLPSLYYRRERGDAIETYKYLHGLYSVDNSFLPRDEGYITRGHPLKLKKRFCKTNTRQNFFSFRVVDMWNSLPESVVTAPSLDCFKSRLDKTWSERRYDCEDID